MKQPAINPRMVLLKYSCSHAVFVPCRQTLSLAEERGIKRQAGRQLCVKCQRQQAKEPKGEGDRAA